MAFLLSSVFLIVLLVFLCPSHSHGSIPMIRCISHESQALLSFKEALNETDSHQGTLSSWVNGTDCCTEWFGISCDKHTNHVVSVSIMPPYLISSDGYYFYANGVISESLCQLPFLTSLAIYGVSGTTLPSCLGNLSYIQSLHLSDNEFSGMVPPIICCLTRLTDLGLSYNRFNGSIPSSLANLSSLSYLSLRSNQLSGSIPASLGSLSLLRYLHLNNNQLSGTIPYPLSNLSLLQWLLIDNNQLSGTVPPSFAQLSSLTQLSAGGNLFNETLSSSSLPPSLVELKLQLNHYQSISETFFHKFTSLDDFSLSDCVLNISTTWIPSFSLSSLYLESCTIDGQFPPWISTQYSVLELAITNASLVGAIPSWIYEPVLCCLI